MIISGTASDDTLQGTADTDELSGLAGNDILRGAEGDDRLSGGAGNDTIDGGPNSSGWGDLLFFAGATTGVSVDLAAGTATDGLGGADTLIGIEGAIDTPFDDVFKGSAGRDYFLLSGGSDSVDGRGGIDTVQFVQASAGVAVNLKAGTATGTSIGNDTLVSIELVVGSNFSDTLVLGDFEGGSAEGRAGDDVLRGGSLGDVLTGGSGNDTLDGGAGIDVVHYASTANDGGTQAPTGQGVNVNLRTGVATDNWGHTDTLVSIEFVVGSSLDDVLTGGNPANGSGATDGFEGFRGLGGNDTIDGGTGYDRVYYDNSPAAVTVTLGGNARGTASDGWGGTDILINIEDVRGSAFNDTLTGSDTGLYESFEGRAGNDTIDGRGGHDRVSYETSPAGVSVNLVAGTAQDGWGGTDTLRNIEEVRGSSFNDSLTGDARNNTLEGRQGDDTLDGGAGFDTVRYDDASGSVTVNLATGTAIGAAGNDTLISIETVRGSGFDDVLIGDAANNGLRGNGGNDRIDGGAGTDAALYANARGTYSIARTATGITVASETEGSDTLTNIERLYFSDGRLAFDITGAAGTTALFVHALGGSAMLQNRAVVGTVLNLADEGLDLAGLSALAVSSGVAASLAGGADNASLVRMLWRNLTNTEATSSTVEQLAGLIGSGSYTQATFVAAVADLSVNRALVNLVGLADTGLAYAV